MAISTHASTNLRAAGSVVANAATPTNQFSIPTTATGRLQVKIKFTLGSLTNATFTAQLSDDGTNWYDVTSPAALQLTATGNKTFSVDCAGAKLFRVSAASTGTTTGSDCQIDVGFQKS